MCALSAAGAGGAHFHEAGDVDPETIADIQAEVRARLVRAAARLGLLERDDAQAMGAWDHGGGFSLVSAGQFREDLLIRLNVAEVRLPPLRERRTDVRPLAQELIQQICAWHKLPVRILHPTAVEWMERCN